MSPWLAVAGGGALGALARFWVYNALAKAGGKFPWATLSVNVLGSLLIGVAYVVLIERGQLPPAWRQFVTVGFLGAFTTFSTFSLDAVALLEQGRLLAACGYVLGSVVLCLLGAWLGLTLTRTWI